MNPYVEARWSAEAQQHYRGMKRDYMLYGRWCEQEAARAANGHTGNPRQGEPDVITPLGAFEFRSSANTKNAAGAGYDSAKLARWVAAHPGRGAWIVQTIGEARGCLSFETFMEMHGLPASRAEEIRMAFTNGEHEDMRLFDEAAA